MGDMVSSLKNAYAGSLSPIPQSMTIFGDRACEEVTKLNEVIRVGLIQLTCAHMRGNFDTQTPGIPAHRGKTA